MAYSQVLTSIANPAGKRKKNVAKRKHFSAAQIRAGFGGKRRKTAAKAKRHNARQTEEQSSQTQTRFQQAALESNAAKT